MTSVPTSTTPGGSLPGEPAASYVDDPIRVDARGTTATTTLDDWVHDMIEAVLFTSPGERVHRPDFGSGLSQLAFEPLSGELATTVQFLVQGALQTWVGQFAEINDVSVDVTDNQMSITVSYTVRPTGNQHIDQFQVMPA